MNTRQQYILHNLERNSECSTQYLAACNNCPEASVRRDIQALIRLGHRISYALNGSYHLYGN